MNLIKMHMKLSTQDCIIIVQKEKKILNLKVFFYLFISYNDLKKLLKVHISFYLIINFARNQ